MKSFLIIESDQSVVNTILKIFENFPDYNCIGVSRSYTETVDIILKETPNLTFINIDEANTNPFGIINELSQYLNNPPAFIAMSSSKDKAYDAIKNGYFDYLIQPLSEFEIRKSTLRFKKKHPPDVKKQFV